jgi:cobalt-zinc-cadmium efflux system outer membrane protein
MLAGCQSYEPAPLDPVGHHRAWTSRSLTAPEVLDVAARLRGEVDEAPFTLEDGLSLAEAEVVALAFNPDLRLARARAGVSAASAQHAGLFPDPSLTGDIGHILNDVDDRFMGAAVLAFTIPVSGRLEAERELAGAARDADIVRMYAAEWQTRIALRAAWTEWSIASERLRVLDHFLEELTSLVSIIESIERAGEIAGVNARLFTLELASRTAERVAAQGAVDRAKARIHRLLGIDQRREISLAAEVAAPASHERAGEGVWASLDHPDALLAKAEYEAAERSLALEVREQYPDIVIGPGLGREDGNDRVILGFSIPIPLFNRNQQGIAFARAERDAARVAYETTLERLHADLGEAAVDLRTSRAVRGTLERDVMSIADRQHEDALRIAELGEVDTLLLLESLTRRFDARFEVLDAMRAESLAAIRFVAAIGPDQTPEETGETQP